MAVSTVVGVGAGLSDFVNTIGAVGDLVVALTLLAVISNITVAGSDVVGSSLTTVIVVITIGVIVLVAHLLAEAALIGGLIVASTVLSLVIRITVTAEAREAAVLSAVVSPVSIMISVDLTGTVAVATVALATIALATVATVALATVTTVALATVATIVATNAATEATIVTTVVATVATVVSTEADLLLDWGLVAGLLVVTLRVTTAVDLRLSPDDGDIGLTVVVSDAVGNLLGASNESLRLSVADSAVTEEAHVAVISAVTDNEGGAGVDVEKSGVSQNIVSCAAGGDVGDRSLSGVSNLRTWLIVVDVSSHAGVSSLEGWLVDTELLAGLVNLSLRGTVALGTGLEVWLVHAELLVGGVDVEGWAAVLRDGSLEAWLVDSELLLWLIDLGFVATVASLGEHLGLVDTELLCGGTDVELLSGVAVAPLGGLSSSNKSCDSEGLEHVFRKVLSKFTIRSN